VHGSEVMINWEHIKYEVKTKRGVKMNMHNESPLFSVTNQKFNVIILAAGLGSRLKPETDYLPKALVELGKGGLRAIDYSIRKYQYIAERFIIALGYSAELLENYIKGKYSSLNIFFSREEVSELCGPGKSLVYALDYASSKLSTIITFCDYVINDQISLEYDSICVCKPSKEDSVLDTYKTVAVVDEGIVVDLKKNEDMENVKEDGFTGIAICHNTKLLKSIVYSAAASKTELEDVDYAYIIRSYIQKVRTLACPLSKIFEFGTEDTLKRTRRYLNGDS